MLHLIREGRYEKAPASIKRSYPPKYKGGTAATGLAAHQLASKNKWLQLIYKFTRLSLYAFLLFLLSDLCFPLKTKIEYAPVIRAKKDMPLYTFLTKDEQWRFYTELDEISPDLSKAIIYKEDRFFYWHPGVNPLAIARA